MDGLFVQEGKDMLRNIDKLRYISEDVKSLFKKQQLFVKINNLQCPILGRVGTYHITVDITGKNVNIGDEVIFNTSIKFVNSNIRREWN